MLTTPIVGYALVQAFEKINISVTGMGIFSLVFAWLLLMMTVVVFVKLNYIFDMLMPKCEIDEEKGAISGHGPCRGHQTNDSESKEEEGSKGTPLLPRQNSGIHAAYEKLVLQPRTDFYHWLLGPPPTRHQMLFWWDRRGVHVIMFIIQGILLNTAMFLSVFLHQIKG